MSRVEPVKKFVQLVLAQSVKDGATEVAIGAVEGDATPVRYKVKGQWYDMTPPPARLRASIVAEFASLAGLREGSFPKQGTIEAETDKVPSKWKLSAPTADGEWVLARVQE